MQIKPQGDATSHPRGRLEQKRQTVTVLGEMGVNGTLVHGWQGCEMGRLSGNRGKAPEKVKHGISMGPGSSAQEKCSQKHTVNKCPRGFVHNSQRVRTTQVSINRGANKHNESVNTPGILLNREKEEHTDTRCSVDGP